MVSPNFRSLIFYIMYHCVRHFKDRFGIHVNTQTVVTFLDIGSCTTCSRIYLLRIIHTLRRYNNSNGTMILVHTRNSGTTSWCYFLLLLAAVVVRLFAPDRLVRARVVLWSTPVLASMKHFAIFPPDTVAAYFFIYVVQFFSGILFFNQSQPWICMEQTKNDSTFDTYV